MFPTNNLIKTHLDFCVSVSLNARASNSFHSWEILILVNILCTHYKEASYSASLKYTKMLPDGPTYTVTQL